MRCTAAVAACTAVRTAACKVVKSLRQHRGALRLPTHQSPGVKRLHRRLLRGRKCSRANGKVHKQVHKDHAQRSFISDHGQDVALNSVLLVRAQCDYEMNPRITCKTHYIEDCSVCAVVQAGESSMNDSIKVRR